MRVFSGNLVRQFPSQITGNAGVGVSVSVYVGKTGTTLASLFNASGVPISNPLTTDGAGYYTFSAADGIYRLSIGFPSVPDVFVDLLDGQQLMDGFSTLQSNFDTFVDTQGLIYKDPDTFTTGSTLDGPNEALRRASDGEYFRRVQGPYPYTVDAGTDPTLDPLYVAVGSAALADRLADADSEQAVGGVPALELPNTINSVADLSSQVRINLKSIIVKSYRANVKGGGGIWIYFSDTSKSSHDGVTVIDPDKVFPADFNDVVQRSSWFTPALSGTGCWVLQDISCKDITIRGYQFDQATNYAEPLSRIMFGQEYLQYFINALRDSRTTAVKVIHSGDSTTENGYGEADPLLGAYPPSMLFTWLCESYGVRVNNINAGHSSQDTVSWDSTYVNADILAHPDMSAYFVRWGINDGSSHGNVQTFETALRSGLQKLRTAFGDNLTIVLMSPNSTYDPDNNRDNEWHESLALILRQAARDFKCFFFDTYSYLRDSKNGANLWMDDAFADGRTVHGFAEFNASIYSEIAKVMLGPIVSLRKNLNRFSQSSGLDTLLTSSVDANAFPYGITTYRTNGGGFPEDGFVIVMKTPDNIIHQRNINYTINREHTRVYNPISETWSDFVRAATIGVSAISPTAGYSSLARTTTSGSNVVSDGYITKSVAANIPAGTVMAIVADGHRPTNDSVYFNATYWDGSTFITALTRINLGGEISPMVNVDIDVQRVWINAAWSSL